MVPRPWLVAVLLVAASALAPLGQAEHPAEEVTLVVVDGPRHDLAFDREGPMQPLYEAPGVTFANDTWTAGPAKTVPGHAALLSGKAQPVANDGSQRPEEPLVWDQLAEDRGWGAEEMRWLYQKDKLGVLASDHAGGGRVAGGPPDEAMLEALEANTSQAQARLVVAAFARPDDTGHEGDWSAHRASLATIAEGIAPLLEQAGEDELVVVTADHARYCQEPDDHGRVGPLGAVDECDAHVPLWVAGWHTRSNATVDACLTQADVGVLVAEAAGAGLPEAEGAFPEPLVNSSAAWPGQGCPPERGGGPLGVPGPGLAPIVISAAIAAVLRRSARAAVGGQRGVPLG
jgi:hypothetical protein